MKTHALSHIVNWCVINQSTGGINFPHIETDVVYGMALWYDLL